MGRELLKRVTLQPHTGVFRKGESGDAMYLVESGRVRIFEEEGGPRQTIKELGLGEFFGEMALVDDKPRSASAETLEETTLLVITRENFDSVVLQNPSMALVLIQSLSDRVRSLTEELERLRAQPSAK
jgi:CRP-like cAMP-binding protein